MRSLPVIDHLSYSQAATANRCSRQWWLKYGAGVLTPASPAMMHGKLVDDVVSAYFRGEHAPDMTDEAARDADAIIREVTNWTSSVVGVQVYHRGMVTGVDVPVIGYSDAILADGTVVDWKCSRMWREDWKTQVSLYHVLPPNWPGSSPLLRGEPYPCRVVRVYNGKVAVYDFEADTAAAEQYVRDAWETLSAPLHPMSPSMACSWCSVREECSVLAALEATV